MIGRQRHGDLSLPPIFLAGVDESHFVAGDLQANWRVATRRHQGPIAGLVC